MPEPRSARRGESSGVARICPRPSGEALSRTQRPPSSLTAIDDWLRGRARTVPARTPAQFRQLQFHCGKPPPAAEPKTLTRTNAAPSRDEQPGAASRNYLVATYIVISKPKRMSSKDGLDHCIANSSSCLPHPGWRTVCAHRSRQDYYPSEGLLWESQKLRANANENHEFEPRAAEAARKGAAAHRGAAEAAP